MTILVLAAERDNTADRMIAELAHRGAEVIRLDTAWFPQDVQLDAQFRAGSWGGYLSIRSRTVDLGRLNAVWYRSPSAFRFPDELTPAERQWAGNEAKLGLGGVLSALPLVWINHPARQADAAVKPVQLAVASRCGLATPDTLVTNLPSAVQRFAASSATVTKALGAPAIIEADRRATAFTHLLTPDDLADLRGVDVTTHQFQHWVPKAHETRLIVVGDRVFAAGIHAGTADTYIDWRNSYADLAYSRPTVPEDVHAAVVTYLEELNLTYGAFDMVVTPEGEWVFLECNPGGQYGWIEAATGYPITASIADLLTDQLIERSAP